MPQQQQATGSSGVPTSGIDQATRRVVVVIVLLVVVAVCLRGYLPGVERAPLHRPPDSAASPLFGLALMVGSLAIFVAAVIQWLRSPRPPTPRAAGLPKRRRGERSRPRWRVLLIAAGLIVAWLVLAWLVSRLIGAPHHIGQLPAGAGSRTPAPTATPTPGNDTAPAAEPRDSGGGAVLGYLAASTAILVLGVLARAVVTARRRGGAEPPVLAAEPSEPSEPAPEGTSETLARAAEVGLAEIGDLSREPRAAIIACYAAMERELARVPAAAPRDFDTPTEVLARAVEHRALHADNAARLVNLFAEARFSSHVMTEEHREIAVHVLQLVLAELPSVV